MSFILPEKITPRPIEHLKLFCVTVETVLYVAAMDSDEAEEIAEESMDQVSDHDSVFGHEVKEAKRIDPDWRDAIPFGLETDETCLQFIERMKAENPESYDHPAQLRLNLEEAPPFPYDGYPT